MFRIQQVAIAAIVAAALASPVVAQQQNYSQVTQADIQRLQDSVFQAGYRRTAAEKPRRDARHAAPGAARRPARRSDLPEGEAA